MQSNWRAVEKSDDDAQQFLIIHRFQGLYADVYLTREEFDEMFNWKIYNQVRAEYKCADAFPHVYDKISRAARGI